MWHTPTATHFNMLQHTARFYNTMQHTATHYNTLLFMCTVLFLIYVAYLRTHCNTLQPTTTQCNTMQHNTTQCNNCNTLQHTAFHMPSCISDMCGVPQDQLQLREKELQHTATRCSRLQHTATHCNTLHHTAFHVPSCIF